MCSDAYILVTRPDPEGGRLCAAISTMGLSAFQLPTLAILPPVDNSALLANLQRLEEQDWLIVISPQAVYQGVPALQSIWPTLPAGLKVAALGASTAQRLQEAGIRVDLYPEASNTNSEQFLQLPPMQMVSGQRIAILRGEGGRLLIDQTLAARGATILPLIAYRRALPNIDIGPVLRLLEQKSIAMIVCTSAESVTNLKTLIDPHYWPMLKPIPLVVMSARVAAVANELGFQHCLVSEGTNETAILSAIQRFKETT